MTDYKSFREYVKKATDEQLLSPRTYAMILDVGEDQAQVDQRLECVKNRAKNRMIPEKDFDSWLDDMFQQTGGSNEAIQAFIDAWTAPEAPGGLGGLEVVRASDVPYEPPQWTIEPYFQTGKGTMIQADPGVGKTAFMCAIAAHVSTGEPLLGLPVAAPGSVIMLSVEDDIPVLRGRVEADGGNIDRVFFVKNAAGLEFSDEKVEQIIQQHEAKMIIFDPLQAFLGERVDMFRANETRPKLAKLFEMCKRNDCCCVIIAHTSKNAHDKSPVNRALGSVDIGAAMRSILYIIQNSENDAERIAVHVKSSNAPRGESLVYTIGDRGGVSWKGFSLLDVEDLERIKKRKAREEAGVPYEQEPLVQVFNQLVTDRPEGGFWSYAELKEAGAKILGFPPFKDSRELGAKLSQGLAKELQQNDGLIVIAGHKNHGIRGIKIERFQVPEAYQKKMEI